MKRFDFWLGVAALAAALCVLWIDPASHITAQVQAAGGGAGAPAFLTDGRAVVTTAGTPVALATSGSVYAITITAAETNAGTVVVGGSTVVAASGTRRGRPLAPGESMTLGVDPRLDVVDITQIYIDATISNDVVTWVGLLRR